MVTHLVVDGSNIATEGRKTPSLKQLEEAVQEFLAERPHDHVIVIVDATFPNRIDKAELARYEHLIDAGWMLTPPAGAIGRGDAFILQVAIKADATVLSNDSFQEFHGDHDWLFQDNRLVGGKPIPGVGWVFVDRAPVRGATSRRAVRDAKRKEAADSPEGDDTSAKSEAVADKAGGRGAKRARGKKDSTDSTDSTDKSAKPAVGDRKASDAAPAGAADDSPKGDKGTDKPILNNAAEFVSFVASNLPGSKVSAVVESFSSHGAYVTVGSTTCYAPLRLMGDPAPRSARSVLTLGETVEFTVHATDPAHNAIDLALVPNDETPPPPKKSAAKKSPAKKSPAKKSAAKKATAKKSAAKKSTAKKSAAKKSPAKKSPAKKATAKKTTAKKSAARKSPAKKSAAKKATAKKSAAKESTATSEATTTPSGSRTRTRTIKPAESEPDPNS